MASTEQSIRITTIPAKKNNTIGTPGIMVRTQQKKKTTITKTNLAMPATTILTNQATQSR